MTWLWISAIVVLLGAEIDAEMEHQTECDTTEGAGKPMGARGARVADTIGAAQATDVNKADYSTELGTEKLRASL
jgi:membrane protein